jgi:dethiobiotin synthetase/adenosylmethionine--8-amino-7-oxononanoate aminotransferase
MIAWRVVMLSELHVSAVLLTHADHNPWFCTQVLALHNSYHGDTVGAMDCAAASAFNGRLQTPWYSGRGCFLMPPYLQLQQGRWRLQAPHWLQQQQQQAGSSGWSWGSRQEAFDLDSRSR